MPEDKSPPSQRPWEHGWAPDTGRAPGTRRLWLAGALAISTIVGCVVAITETHKETDDASARTKSALPGSAATVPGLISFATPSASGSGTPGGTRTPSTTAGSTSATSTPTGPAAGGTSPAASAKPAESAGSSGGSAATPAPSAAWTAVRSVNYPDRYWQMSGGLVKLDQVGSPSPRQGAAFRRVDGLADASCYSFATADGGYLRHRDFVLRAEPDDGSSLFRKDATFCPRTSSVASGAVMLEAVNYPGRFLRHKNFQLRLDPYQNSDLYRADATFRLVAGPS
ncbi:AbfB domain-containing protein [Streptomyces sp. NPDC059766]|uniref:AbfB domain-containing protein n=1 Tax=Streptomyces sp. NPDC059766 TaxID=3346940 RepID=UPI00365367AC